MVGAEGGLAFDAEVRRDARADPGVDAVQVAAGLVVVGALDADRAVGTQVLGVGDGAGKSQGRSRGENDEFHDMCSKIGFKPLHLLEM